MVCCTRAHVQQPNKETMVLVDSCVIRFLGLFCGWPFVLFFDLLCVFVL
jgi:hypothetical protein